MTPSAHVLLDDLDRAGVHLYRLDGGQLGCRAPKGALTAEARERIAAHRAELLEALGNCPECKRPLKRGICWRCHWRRCRCGKPTGSAFIQTCILCG